MKYFINGICFNNKTQIYEHTKKIIYNHGYGEIKRGDKEFTFLNELIKHHPNYETKIGVGLRLFRLSQNKQNVSAIHMDIERLDHSYVGCGWDIRKMIKKNKNTLLSKAMRNCVKDQTINYKINNEYICKLCKYKSDIRQWFHVDHVIPFSKLKNDFIKKNKAPTKFGKDNNCLDIFLEDDLIFEKKWQSYHNKKAKYQILCKKCNQKKGCSF